MSAIVFDLDGTMVHSAPDLHAAAVRMLGDFGLPPLSLGKVTSFIGNGVPVLVAKCLGESGAADVSHDDALACFREHYMADPATLSRPFPGVLHMLHILRHNGYQLGICTNKSADLTLEVLKRLDLVVYFDVVIGGDSLASRKPDPAPLLAAFDRLGADISNGLYVGDSEVDAATAAAAHCDFALFSGGYRKTPVEQLQARYVFDSFEALTDYILTNKKTA
ncbi:phosphoglycolate phosphatase [Thalassospiraceae bacterium LMO-JJ14]|nr:phosphoglycolate phosphatase [Thalassospiraceae bacterium LMO-JJ14]